MILNGCTLNMSGASKCSTMSGCHKALPYFERDVARRPHKSLRNPGCTNRESKWGSPIFSPRNSQDLSPGGFSNPERPGPAWTHGRRLGARQLAGLALGPEADRPQWVQMESVWIRIARGLRCWTDGGLDPNRWLVVYIHCWFPA